MYQRFIHAQILKALKDTPVIFLNGPRQAGKSTLMHLIHQKDPKSELVTFDDYNSLTSAQADPQGFLQNGNKRLIIDEVQRVPELFLTIKYLVDQNRKPGKFLLTGSSNVLLLPKIADSLAGRMEIFSLFPLSIGELAGKKESIIKKLFQTNPSFSKIAFSRKQLEERILLGGYPEVQTRKNYERRNAWFRSYITTILQRDVRDMANIEGLTRLPHLLRLLANRTGTLLNMDEVSRSSGFPSTTLKRYFILLQTVFLISLLPSWSSNRNKRLVKSPKLYLNDTGLTCHLLGIDEKALKQPKIWGALLESFVINEFNKIRSWTLPMLGMYHYRTKSGEEVDLVLEMPDGRIVGVEIKATESILKDDFKGLKRLQEETKDRFVRGVIFYSGNQRLSFGRNLLALPLQFC